MGALAEQEADFSDGSKAGVGAADAAMVAADAVASEAVAAPELVSGPKPCPVAGCTEVLFDLLVSTRGLAQLARECVEWARDLRAAKAAARRLKGCYWCLRPFSSARGRVGRSALASNEAQ